VAENMSEELKGLPEVDEVKELIREVSEILEKEPQLLELENLNALVVGDLHGDYASLKEVLNLWSKNYREDHVLIFLGDYVDRGPNQIEVMVEVLRLKIESPQKVFLLRGNHETKSVSSTYGFREELSRKYPEVHEELYVAFIDMFSKLPYGVCTCGYLLIHGGLAQGFEQPEQLNDIPKSLIDPEDHELALQILWNDPVEYIEGFIPSPRGEGVYLYGPDVTKSFVERNNLKGIIRSHEPCAEGYEFLHEGLTLTIFTCREYSYPISIAVVNNEELKVVIL